jgi:type IV secretion system protein VirB5
MMFVSAPARAGIPVIDVTAIVQAVLDVMNGLTQIENQYQQIVGLERQIESISNARSLGDVLNNQALQNYVPREANTMVRSLESGGYGTLGGASKALRDAQMTYNCMDVDDAGKRTTARAHWPSPTSRRPSWRMRFQGQETAWPRSTA